MTKEIIHKVHDTLEDMLDMFEDITEKYDFQEWLEENTDIEKDTFFKRGLSPF